MNGSARRLGAPRGEALAFAILAAWVAGTHGSLLACMDGCFVDLDSLQGEAIGALSTIDTRLNAWILAWVSRALLRNPGEIFRGNIFYPMEDALAGSEHLIGVSLQLLPLRPLLPGAVALHQAAIVLSALLLGWGTLRLTRWLSGSTWAGLVAGWIAIQMPWRVTELSHVQILSVQGFPWIWYLSLRLLGEGGGRRCGLLLFAATSLQLLSSFYLAYMLTFSLAVLGICALAAVRPPLRRVAGWVASLAPAYGLFLLSALPYLRRARAGALPVTFDADTTSSLQDVAWMARYVAPRLDWLPGLDTPGDPTFSTPPLALLLAVAGLFSIRNLAGPGGDGRALRRSAVAFLLALAVGSFALMLGYRLRVGSIVVPLPAGWAADWIPGFANLRAPQRWALLIGLALPILAGLGVRGVEATLLRFPRGSRTWRSAGRAAVAGALLASSPWGRIPVVGAWPGGSEPPPVYRDLARLPAGPVLELPWYPDRLRRAGADSRAMLASTLHWRPILNGTTAYIPRSYFFLLGLASGLPRPDAFQRLLAFVDLRWLLLHRPSMERGLLAEFDRAETGGWIERRLEVGAHRVYEVHAGAEAGRFREALVSAERRPQTVSGLPREALDAARATGSLAVHPRNPFRYFGDLLLPAVLDIEVANRSRVPWPGLDPDPEGLVAIRATFARGEAPLVAWTVPLYADVPAGGSARSTTIVPGEGGAGASWVCFELVQEVGGAVQPLAVGPVARRLPLPPAGIQDPTGASLSIPRLPRPSRMEARPRLSPACRDTGHAWP